MHNSFYFGTVENERCVFIWNLLILLQHFGKHHVQLVLQNSAVIPKLRFLNNKCHSNPKILKNNIYKSYKIFICFIQAHKFFWEMQWELDRGTD